MAYATDDSGSLAKIGSASRLGSNVSPSRSLRNGRPTTSRFTDVNTAPVKTLREPANDLDVFLTRSSSILAAP